MSRPDPAAAAPPRACCQGLGGLLRRLRDSEAKRLELERKLMEYRKSDAYLMKTKYVKLKRYLKEIEERQKGALLRNQTFLKEFDQFEAHMKASSSEMIQKMEAWYGREIRSMLPLQEGNLSAEGDREAEYNKQMPQVGRQAEISTKTGVLTGLYHPATVFMGCHTSAVSAAGSLGAQQNHPQPTESCLTLDSPSCSLSVEEPGPERRNADLESDASVEGVARHRDLAASEEGSEQLISSASDLKPATPKEEEPQGSIPEPKPCLSNWWTCKEASWESSSKLPVPRSAEEVVPSTAGMLHGTAPLVTGWERSRDAHTVEGSPLQPPNPAVAHEEPSVSSGPDGHHRMLVGLSCALQLIEDVVVRMSPQRQALYQGKHVGTMGTAELLSFCNRAGNLKEEDLEACEAVVLHQLQALLQSALNGCLLPEKTLDAKGAAVDEKQTRPDQQWDVDVLRTCLSSHALFLKKHQVQLTEEVAEMFGRLLVSSKEAQDGQALPVLREVLPEECGDRPSIQSNESSYSLPSIPNDGEEIKPAKHAPWLAGAGEQEVTSWCEDESKEESTVEKIPITGCNIGSKSSKAKESQESHSETSSSLNGRSPPFSSIEMRKGTAMAIRSKAFWGESDDSSSEIEAALRPQTHSTEGDEFDDFYD
ncbi:centrosomal protein kizuna isoform X3 [Falco peregrinus]|uniref:centrosomal protein kizuna isoform X3 n=1 Tax=Falco peregrinus TaxID=8954 RepID=UPI00247AB9BF|nr:centrosomal protein kizuna isoform X3 [Falco peregrinus]